MVKPVNYDKVREFNQEEGKNQAVFLGQVIAAFREDTSIDRESIEGRTALAMDFITQATPDIQRKLQRLEAGLETPLST